NKTKKYLNKVYPDINLYESPFELQRSKNIFSKLKYHFSGFLTAMSITKPQGFINNLTKETDLVIFNGGNLFRAKRFVDYARLIALMYPLKIANKNNIPYMIFPQSASNIDKIGYYLLKKDLVNLEMLWTREEISNKYLKDIFGFNNLYNTIDLSFFSNKHKYARKEFKNKYPLILKKFQGYRIAFTIRAQVVGDLGNLKRKKVEKIKNVITNTISNYLNENDEIVLVIQTKKDKKITKELYNKFEKNQNIHLIEEYDPLIIKEIYRNCDILVGMRLHSIILSLSAGTPAIGFFEESWGYKNPGMMKKFNLPYEFIKDNVSNLNHSIKQVLKNRKEYINKIDEIIHNEKKKFTKKIQSLLEKI
ncbi:MAG: polysaccharide pyruvyl transferase family protein, partial [archaeon]